MEALCDSSLIEVKWLCRARVVALTVDVNFLFNVSTALFGEFKWQEEIRNIFYWRIIAPNIRLIVATKVIHLCFQIHHKVDISFNFSYE